MNEIEDQSTINNFFIKKEKDINKRSHEDDATCSTINPVKKFRPDLCGPEKFGLIYLTKSDEIDPWTTHVEDVFVQLEKDSQVNVVETEFHEQYDDSVIHENSEYDCMNDNNDLLSHHILDNADKNTENIDCEVKTELKTESIRTAKVIHPGNMKPEKGFFQSKLRQANIKTPAKPSMLSHLVKNLHSLPSPPSIKQSISPSSQQSKATVLPVCNQNLPDKTVSTPDTNRSTLVSLMQQQSSLSESYIKCSRCKKIIDPNFQQEHEDEHFARDLQRQTNEEYNQRDQRQREERIQNKQQIQSPLFKCWDKKKMKRT